MAAVEVPQTLKYRGGQLNAAPVLEVENFTNWKKRFMCHIISIEPQFENIIKNGPFIPMTVGQRKPENQWTRDERKAANLYQRLKSLIMLVFQDDQMNSDFQDSPDDEEDTEAVMKQRNNLMSKHRNLVQELNTCEEQLLVLEQAKLDLLTIQHVNTEILKENQNLKNQLKELSSIIEAWLNSSSKVNKCISEQIPTQKRKILGIDQLTKDTSSSGPKDLVFVKSSADNSEVSITSSNKPKLSKTEDSTLSNHDTSKSVAPPPPLRMEKRLKREALQAKKVESFKASKTKSSSALRSNTLTKRPKKDNETIEYGCNIDSKITSDACQLLEGKLTAKRVDQQATSDPTSLGVTGEARANSQLSSALPTTEANPENSAPSDFASSVARQIKEETSSTIKLEDLANLVSHVQPSFKDLDSPEDDPVIVVADSDEDEDDEFIAMTRILKLKYFLFPNPHLSGLIKFKSLPTKSSFFSLKSTNWNLRRTKLKLLSLKLNPHFLMWNNSKSCWLKKQVHELEIELPGDLKEIPTKLEDFTKTVTSLTSQVASLTLDALPCLLLNVTKALNKFSQVLDFASSKAGDQSVPLAGQADTRPDEGEKDTNQATISQLFQRRAKKIVEYNLNKNKP
ncbi:hypothetical protein Tco_0699566 [Tanacetum coccineum]